jgi:hypothetical protein
LRNTKKYINYTAFVDVLFDLEDECEGDVVTRVDPIEHVFVGGGVLHRHLGELDQLVVFQVEPGKRGGKIIHFFIKFNFNLDIYIFYYYFF